MTEITDDGVYEPTRKDLDADYTRHIEETTYDKDQAGAFLAIANRIDAVVVELRTMNDRSPWQE